MSIIELNNVNTIYEGAEIPTIRNINLEIEEGEFVSVMGPNGAGKTTLLETINGLIEYTSGEVVVFGKDVKEAGCEVREEVGNLVQNFSFNSSDPFLVKDVVMMGRTGKIGLFRNPDERDWEIVRDSLKSVGMEDFMDRPIGKLSGGEQQKVLLARVLAQRPEVLLLDEPLTNLDLKAKDELLELIVDIFERNDLTVVMVTHDVGSVPEVSSRLVLMNSGEIALDGTPEEVIESGVWKTSYGLA
uniref:(Zinc) transport protein(ABC transporter, ATP-binding protein) n=1 Tax=uncultured organism TaxID=155900 RepID=M1PPN9_9ZZZZ|nr:(zinc) transport protein(ABC transporter, ATP-binding protein) [uncultured organism]